MISPAIMRQDASRAMAQLIPRIIRGAHLDFFTRISVTQTQFFVLVAIHGHTQCTMGTLSRNAHVSMPTMSGIVDRLTKAGYVTRAPRAVDRRQVVVSVTSKGRALIGRFQAVIQKRWEEVLRSLKPRELQAFYHVISQLMKALQRAA